MNTIGARPTGMPAIGDLWTPSGFRGPFDSDSNGDPARGFAEGNALPGDRVPELCIGDYPGRLFYAHGGRNGEVPHLLSPSPAHGCRPRASGPVEEGAGATRQGVRPLHADERRPVSVPAGIDRRFSKASLLVLPAY